jgi:hypothetical protein
MRVHVLGDGDAGVPEHLGDHVQRRALSQHQRGARVTQLVRVPVTQARLLAQPGERVREVVRDASSASDCVALQGRPVEGAPLRSRRHGGWRERHPRQSCPSRRFPAAIG